MTTPLLTALNQTVFSDSVLRQRDTYKAKAMSTIPEFTIDDVVEAYKFMGYRYFVTGKYNLNIFGIRNLDDPHSNRFNDLICLTYVDDFGKMNLKKYAATTDPGLYYRRNPMNPKGTAVLIPGQYRGVYKVGLHTGYEALVQYKPMKYWRDNNRNDELDFSGQVYEEVVATNIHRATAIDGLTSNLVDKYSAGCQVIASKNQYKEFMYLVNKSRDIFGNSFTYTLFTTDNFFRVSKDNHR
jgi:hypothetical protein